MARRKRFSIVATGTAALIGIALYLPGSAPFINGLPVSHGYGGANCPVGISVNVTPSTVTYGGLISITGRLIPEAGANVSGKLIAIKKIRGGTSTVSDTATVTTDSNGFFQTSLSPFWSAFHTARWAGTGSCPAEKGGNSNSVRVKIYIGRFPSSVAAGATYRIAGGVRFGHPGGYVYLQSFKQGVGTITTVTLGLNQFSNYSRVSRNFSRGVYWFRAIFPTQDADHLGGHTGWVSVKVV
jgi:hypothetical protein